MEEKSAEEGAKMLKEKLLVPRNQKGGLKTMPFIIANEAFERLANNGLNANMITYLMGAYRLPLATGTKILYMWSALGNFLPIVGAFLSDCYFGRFSMIGFGCISCLLGTILLWLTSVFPEARPPPCDGSTTQACESSTVLQLIVLCISFILMSMGTAGIRPCSLAFGADQLDKRENNPGSSSFSLEKYFSVYYTTGLVSMVLGITCVVYIQDHYGWTLGFGIPAVLMFLSTISFFVASPLYIKSRVNKSLILDLAQVIVVSFKNRHLKLPSETSNGLYHRKMGSELIAPSDKLRCLNKACLIRNPEEGVMTDSDSCILCTVDQVEELKALLKVLPIWSSGFIISVTIYQNSLLIIQANSMDRHITSSFEIPAASFSIFLIISVVTSLSFYNFVVLPLASKIIRRPASFSIIKRMGFGLVCSCLSIGSLAIIEGIRRQTAIDEGLADDPQAVVKMSALWLLPYYCLSGMAEAFYGIGQYEFFYREFPKTMSSIATSLNGVGLAIGNLLANFIFSNVDRITGGKGKVSWVSSNPNKGHYDYYYWLLFGLSLVNLVYYIVCSKAYGSTASQANNLRDEEVGIKHL